MAQRTLAPSQPARQAFRNSLPFEPHTGWARWAQMQAAFGGGLAVALGGGPEVPAAAPALCAQSAATCYTTTRPLPGCQQHHGAV
jgi:hypothetical protein